MHVSKSKLIKQIINIMPHDNRTSTNGMHYSNQTGSVVGFCTTHLQEIKELFAVKNSLTRVLIFLLHEMKMRIIT